ncbi:MAG TPA: EVE domain-containing protein, partial [Thermoanaerobaculia bacterium]
MAIEIASRDLSPTLDAARAWIDRCLIADVSVLSTSSLWTGENINEVRKAFVDHPDEGKDDFMTKLRKQMGPAPPPAQQLMAEMLWALLLFPSNVNPGTKRKHIRSIWAMSGTELPDDAPALSDDVLVGIGSGGPGFNNYRARELAFLIDVAGDLKPRTEVERKRILSTYDE